MDISSTEDQTPVNYYSEVAEIKEGGDWMEYILTPCNHILKCRSTLYLGEVIQCCECNNTNH